ncbi:MAG TPA: trehalose-6-phosphate synthase [Candidatus Saccharimonadales bacterium]
MTNRLIIVSNRLPVSVQEEHGHLTLSRSNGGLATALASLFNQETSLWVGWTGLRRHLSKRELTRLQFPPCFVPVNLTQKDIAGYYDGFSNSILWPLAHGLPISTHHTPELWHIYQRVAEHFADTLTTVLRPTDVIWIHDYHLIALPGILRDRGVTNKIGFFLHTPFFPPTMLSAVPHISELMHSLQAADLIGLQTAHDVANFNGAATQLAIPMRNAIKAFPIGIDFEQFDSQIDDAHVQSLVVKNRQLAEDKTVIFSLSRLDYTKGIITQLDAYERLLRTMKEPQRLMYRLNVAPSREQAHEYVRLKHQIEHHVQAINQKYQTAAWQPILYSYENLGVQDIASWHQIADIHLNLPIADGMNLIAKEYIASRREPGVLIISSTMGAAAQLTDAIIVPPNNTRKAAEALMQALAMEPNERAKRWQQLRKTVRTTQAADWAKSFLESLSLTP